MFRFNYSEMYPEEKGHAVPSSQIYICPYRVEIYYSALTSKSNIAQQYCKEICVNVVLIGP